MMIRHGRVILFSPRNMEYFNNFVDGKYRLISGKQWNEIIKESSVKITERQLLPFILLDETGNINWFAICCSD